MTTRTLAAVLCALSALVACAKLTAPPSPEPIAIDVPPPSASVAKAAPAATPTPTPTAPTIATAPATAAATAASPAGDAGAEKLVIKDLVVGKGKQAKTGDTVSVHYAGKLLDGTPFDASRDHGQPFEFQLGQGRVIKGWDEGVPGMKVGGKRRLTIPPMMGYGMRGAPPKIPPMSTLVFDVELLGVK